MEKLITGSVELLLLPPGLFVALLVLTLVTHKRKVLSTALLTFTLLAVYVLSAPIVSERLVGSIEPYPAIVIDGNINTSGIGAIVVLAGGRERDASEYGGDTLSKYSLQRARYGAVLAKRLDLPVLVTGGTVYDSDRVPEAELIKDVLEQEFSVPVRWIETQSRTTWENGTFSAAILTEAGVSQVFLVTHASHMPRAVYAFGQAGIKVTPAPTAFLGAGQDPSFYDWLPSMKGLSKGAVWMHETLGLWWYRVKDLVARRA